MKYTEWQDLIADSGGNAQVYLQSDKLKPLELPSQLDGFQLETCYFGRPVIGKILILPYLAALNLNLDVKWAGISIREDKASSEEAYKALSKKANNSGILPLYFHDISKHEQARKGYTLMDMQQAFDVVKFVEKMWNQIDLLMIHCHAGISRSTGIGKALSEVYQPKFTDYFSKLYSPNPHVYNCINTALKAHSTI